jgi:hypothetical protein
MVCHRRGRRRHRRPRRPLRTQTVRAERHRRRCSYPPNTHQIPFSRRYRGRTSPLAKCRTPEGNWHSPQKGSTSPRTAPQPSTVVQNEERRTLPSAKSGQKAWSPKQTLTDRTATIPSANRHGTALNHPRRDLHSPASAPPRAGWPLRETLKPSMWPPLLRTNECG